MFTSTRNSPKVPMFDGYANVIVKLCCASGKKIMTELFDMLIICHFS